MKKKGFTLIELIAVIIILAVIALISTPIVLNVIEDAKEKSNLNSVYGIIDGARLYFAESLLDETKLEDINNNRNIYGKVVIQGEKPAEGYLYADKNGMIGVAVIYGNKCYKKGFAEEKVSIHGTETCELGYVGEDNDLPEITYEVQGTPFNDQNWAKDNFFVKIKVSDSTSGVSSYKWCVSNSECDPMAEVKGETNTVSIINESESNQICVIAKDNKGNITEKKCSELYKLDKTAPVIEGVTNVAIDKGTKFNLEIGISATDSLSGINVTYSYNPTTVDTTTVGNKEVIYTVSDKAGNITNITRTIEVLGEAPSINFSTTGTFNSEGWSKENFYIKASIIDNSGKGIKSTKWCSTAGESCTPSAVVTGEITSLVNMESTGNKLCVETRDNNNRSTTLCSNSYKLDKTVPEISGITDIRVSKGETVNLQTGITVNDSLSGIKGTFTYSPTNVDTNKAGTTVVTYTVIDNADNVTTTTRQVVVDAVAPTVTYTPQGSPFNSNGWAKANFYVKGEVTDNSGTGIKEAKWCSTTSAICTPITVFSNSVNTLINTESASNRICISVTDNNNKTTTLCSNTYKLDKTAPTINGTKNITVIVDEQLNLLKDVTANDNLSGLNGNIVVKPNNINTSIVGITDVIYTISDKAGNIVEKKITVDITRDYTISSPISGATYGGPTAGHVLYVTLNSGELALYGFSGGNLSKIISAGTDLNSVSAGTITTHFTYALKKDGTINLYQPNDGYLSLALSGGSNVKSISTIGYVNPKDLYGSVNGVYALKKDGTIQSYYPNNGYLVGGSVGGTNIKAISAFGYASPNYIGGGINGVYALTTDGKIQTYYPNGDYLNFRSQGGTNIKAISAFGYSSPNYVGNGINGVYALTNDGKIQTYYPSGDYLNLGSEGGTNIKAISAFGSTSSGSQTGGLNGVYALTTDGKIQRYYPNGDYLTLGSEGASNIKAIASVGGNNINGVYALTNSGQLQFYDSNINLIGSINIDA